MHLREIGSEIVGLLHLTQNKDQWRAVVNKVMNLRVSEITTNFLTL